MSVHPLSILLCVWPLRKNVISNPERCISVQKHLSRVCITPLRRNRMDNLNYAPSASYRNRASEEFFCHWLGKLFQSSKVRSTYANMSTRQVITYKQYPAADVTDAELRRNSTKQYKNESRARSRSPEKRKRRKRSLSPNSKTTNIQSKASADSADPSEIFVDLKIEELATFFSDYKVQQTFALMCLRKLEDVEKGRQSWRKRITDANGIDCQRTDTHALSA